MSTTAAPIRNDLGSRWDHFRRDNPNVRIRNAAAALGVSEAELVAIDQADGVTRLTGDWGQFLMEVNSLGTVMALTRNDACVHEKTGSYSKVEIMALHKMGLVLDKEIDLRLFMDHWHYGFAVQTVSSKSPDGLRRSFQFFDRFGVAVHKIFLTQASTVSAYEALVDKYAHPDPPALTVATRKQSTPEESAGDFDKEAFLRGWSELRDTHDFFPLISKHRVSRLDALQAAEGAFSERVEPESVRQALQLAVSSETSIMVFVGSPGCIQIHTGPIYNLRATPPWYNVLDPTFNLHLNMEKISTAWVVRKPTDDGVVTALELYDSEGEQIAQFFGARKPGVPELPAWTAIVDRLRRL